MATAIASPSEFSITENLDLLVLNLFDLTQIMTLGEFLQYRSLC